MLTQGRVVTRAPASGERSAVRGYRWQYDHIAALVYDSLLDGDFERLRLTDPTAGRVDDLVLLRRGRADGYQFKSVEFDGYVTFRDLTKDQRTRSGKAAPSLVRSLADGWKTLSAAHGAAAVHLVMQQLASIHDHLGDEAAEDRPVPDHFSAFRAQVLEPIRQGRLVLAEVASGWRPAIEAFRRSTALPEEKLESFLRVASLEVAAGPGLPAAPSTRQADIVDLSNALFRLVATSPGVVELDLRRLLELMGWTARATLHSRHEFPIDLDTYAPLEQAIEALHALLSRFDNGYAAVLGPPGAGKSTLLSQALSGRRDRVVRYYAYVPGSAAARTRLTARGFLHDLVVMLSDAGLSSRDRQLPGDDVNDLRQQLADQLDAAGQDFTVTGRRTIVVVDGLDHVDRDYTGSDGLLGELPRPDALPPGVVFVVGSRTLGPLHAYARSQIDERRATVDLESHPLTPAAVLDVCRRAPVTAALAPDLHRRIADLSRGHPLALSYLLNRLRDLEDRTADEVLADAPTYAGDIAAEYLAVWDTIEGDADLVTILEVCSRLRIGFTTGWLATWAPHSAVRNFERELLYLFRHHHDGWRFFHDSFRQFASDRTALIIAGGPDGGADAEIHKRIAELCAIASDPRMSAEELFHRHSARQFDAVLHLAQQTTLRSQYRSLRSPEYIRTDIAIALAVAADRGDVVALLRGVLSVVELTQRTDALENIDLPGLLYDVGLVDEAIGICGAESRRVPLAYAYRLAARLGRADDPAGRRIFDLVEHDGFDDPDPIRTSEHEDDAAVAWSSAAPLFRPLPGILGAIRDVADTSAPDDPDDGYRRRERWRRFRRMTRGLIEVLTANGDEPGLLSTDEALAGHIDDLVRRAERDGGTGDGDGGDDQLQSEMADLVDLRFLVNHALVEMVEVAETAEQRLNIILSILRGAPLFYSTMLDVAELFAEYGMTGVAEKFLDESPYARALTVRALGHDAERDVIERHFRYWRLRYLLAAREDEVPSPVPPAAEAPAGDGIAPDAPVQSDHEAIELAARIDRAVIDLARLDAATASGSPVPPGEAWARVVPLLDVFRPSGRGRGSASYGSIAEKRSALVLLIVEVILRYGDPLPERLTGVLRSRFDEDPERWPTRLRMQIADVLRTAGVAAPWYPAAVEGEEAAILDQDVYSRLDDMEGLARRYIRDGNLGKAKELTLSLIPAAFGVGYRKDYQFDSWVAWLGRALAERHSGDLIEDAVWLARVLTAAKPMTEGAPGSAAAELAGELARVAPASAVRVFEFLVRQGTVHHLDALAALLEGVVVSLGPGDLASLELVADMTADLVAPAANRAYPELARALVGAAKRLRNTREAEALAYSVAARTERFALPTTRTVWREGLGLPVEPHATDHDEGLDSSTDYGALVLTDGQRISRRDLPRRVQLVDELIALRRTEAPESTYSWARVIDELRPTAEQVQRLASLFKGEGHSVGEALAALAAAAERAGAADLALRLANIALLHTSPEAWSSSYGGSRRRAVEITVRVGGMPERVKACRDLTEQVMSSRWFPCMLIDELAAIVEGLDPEVSWVATWTEVRNYLDGLAETLNLPGGDILGDARCRWWLLSESSDRRERPATEAAADALAETAVGHLSHPTWVVRDAATRIVIRSLPVNDSVVAALGRFVDAGMTDDMLERAGRCFAGARAYDPNFARPELERLAEVLASHPSAVLRDLSPDHSLVEYRRLAPIYRLALPPLPDAVIGDEPVFLAPHEGQYQLLADGLDLDEDTLLGVASRYAREALTLLPDDKEVRKAIDSSHLRHTFSSEKIAASRAGFGRVLADITDARLLGNAPEWVLRRLRTIDPDLLQDSPLTRPAVLPAPVAAGHDQTLERWGSTLRHRLEEYVTASNAAGAVLIGARCDLTVLNWEHLEEEFRCGLVVGREDSLDGPLFFVRSALLRRDLVEATPATEPGAGDRLILENIGHVFHQIQADWLAFRPDIAAKLLWTPEATSPGR